MKGSRRALNFAITISILTLNTVLLIKFGFNPEQLLSLFALLGLRIERESLRTQSQQTISEPDDRQDS